MIKEVSSELYVMVKMTAVRAQHPINSRTCSFREAQKAANNF